MHSPSSKTSRRASHPEPRPLPLRAYTSSDTTESAFDTDKDFDHVRRKSTYLPFGSTTLSARRPKFRHSKGALSTVRTGSEALPSIGERQQYDSTGSPNSAEVYSTLPTPPMTPTQAQIACHGSDAQDVDDVHPFDFSKIDYELERARVLGCGLWSAVYLAEPIKKASKPLDPNQATPPSTPHSNSTQAPNLFAVKLPARKDAKEIFNQEAKVLTRLQQYPDASNHIVRFYGLDSRNASLVFEGVIGGSLETLGDRLKVMTELARHLEMRSIFPGLADNLISGLSFIHNAGVIHADIKPGNVLLDISENQNLGRPVLRPRYIDFSASFLQDGGSAANAGGTWDYMAPEQLRIQKELNTPTFASDVWSLGVTLLSVIVGGSPYKAACGENLFMLREAIKCGDVLSFARMDPVVQKRLVANQDFVDCCRLALQKDREKRTSAAAWEAWVEEQDFGQ